MRKWQGTYVEDGEYLMMVMAKNLWLIWQRTGGRDDEDLMVRMANNRW